MSAEIQGVLDLTDTQRQYRALAGMLRDQLLWMPKVSEHYTALLGGFFLDPQCQAILSAYLNVWDERGSLDKDIIAGDLKPEIATTFWRHIASSSYGRKVCGAVLDEMFAMIGKPSAMVPSDKFDFAGPLGRGGGRGRAGYEVRGVTLSSESSSKGKNRKGLAIRLAADVLAAMKWQRGDKVQTAVDVARCMLAIKRVTSDGYTLTPNGSSKKPSPNHVRFRASNLFTKITGFPKGPPIDCQWRGVGDILVIDLRPEWCQRKTGGAP